MRNFKSLTLLILATIVLNSCGVLFYGKKQSVMVNSTPAGAEIYVNGTTTGQTTPATVRVTRKVRDSPTSTKKKMTYLLKKEGYQDYTQVDNSKFNHLTFWPGFFFYGIPSVIDAAVGTNRRYPKIVNVSLSSGSSSNNGLLIDRSKEIEPKTTAVAKEKTTTPVISTTATTNKPTNPNSSKKVETITKGVSASTVTIIPPKVEEKEEKPIVAVTIPTTEKEIIKESTHFSFNETFDNNNYGWPEEDSKKRVFKVNNGHYNIDHTSIIQKKLLKPLSGFNSKEDSYRLEVKTKFTNNKKNGGYGIFYPVEDDTSSMYSILIDTDDKTYSIYYTIYAGKYEQKILKETVYCKAILQKGNYNTVTIEKIGKNVRYYINDALIHEMNNFVISGSLFGMSEYVKDGIAIDYIKIENLGNNAQDENLTSTKEAEIDNYREEIWQEVKKSSTNISSENISTNTEIIKTEASQEKKLKKSEENIAAEGLKYRRSSLYTLMINDPNRDYSAVIQNSFGNEMVPQKFNNHNIGPYYINSIAELKTQDKIIETYLNENDVAKQLVAKWFMRNKEGKFNMSLIAERGMYDATAMDKVVANSSERGNAMLADAGEELIGKTFVIVNDYKFTSKEEIAQKTKKGLNFIKDVSSLAGVDVSGMTDLAGTAVTIAGKGYIIKSTSYLYRLVWDEEAAAIFYNNYWTDDNSYNPSKAEAFNKANNFKLKYVGVQSAWADVQSSVFTDKSEEDLVQMATIKATDKAIAKLERKFEEFRTMTPLYSTDPLAAKIGLKEGLEKGDKFEVLEQEIDKEGKTTYKRVAIIKVDGGNIWDNTLTEAEREELKREGKLPAQEYTVFKGGGSKFYPGQLLKQIN